MKFLPCLAIFVAVASVPVVQAQDAKFVGSTTDQLAHHDPIHWVDVAQIEKSLEGKPPMTVGFDIDDTVLFSSPCFFYGQQKYSPGKFDYLKNQAFWDDINKNCDINYSIPKDIAANLIAMHTKRGDTIYFITGRTKSEGERVTETIKRDFAMETVNPVVFTAGDATKTAFLKEKGVKVYYGDADGDMKQALEVGARPIRVLRASNTTYKPMPKNGSFGEEVIIDSDH
jgi:acid phosphatase (class B)